MELRQIETFLIVAELGGFSRAAEKLGYSQSAVTMQVKQLESELGARLLDRVPRGAVLTEQGRAFAFHAREMMAEAERAVTAVRAEDDGEISGRLRIGSVESIATAVLPGLLARFHARHPLVEMVVSTALVEQLVDGVMDNRLDVLLTMDRELSVPHLERTLLAREDIVFAAAPELADEVGSLHLAELPDVPLVLTETGESYRHELEMQLARLDKRLHPIVETGNTEMLVHLAERGVGVAYLPRFSVEASFEAGTLVELSCDMEPVSLWNQMFIHKAKPPAPALMAFTGLVRERFA